MATHESDGIVWRKSSFSGGNGACVEVGWRKSSFSNGANARVEVAAGQPNVAVRDSKAPTGPTLAFGHPAWHAFLTARRSG